MEQLERHILLPVDGSDHSRRAATWFSREFARPGDKVYFLHIVESPTPKSNCAVNQHQELDKMLGSELHQTIRNNEIQIEFITQSGTKPGEVICQVTRDYAIHVIIIGNRGLGILRRTFLGSVSEYVLHHSNTPVIVIPPAHHKN